MHQCCILLNIENVENVESDTFYSFMKKYLISSKPCISDGMEVLA